MSQRSGTGKRLFFFYGLNMELFVIVLLIAAQLVREYFTQKERSQLLDRIMSKSYVEFKDNEKPEENQLEPKDSGFTDIEEAKADILNGED